MAIDAEELRKRASEIARHPRTRKIAIWIVAIIVAIGILGALVAPLLLRGKLASVLSEKLHREVSIEQIRINPYTMTATLRGFLMKERQSTATAVSFDEIYVNLELESLFRLGPVLKAIRLAKPYVNLVRNENFKYNFQDLIDEFTSGPSGPTPRFALKNIEIIDGKIDFDDRPEQTKHTISNIKIGVPFISSIPSQVDIKVQPVFSALINGSPLVIGGETKPFTETLESQFRFNLDNLNIPKYLTYSPVELNFKVPSGQIDGKLTLAFKTAKGQASVLALSGDVIVQDFVMQEISGVPLLKLPSLEVAIAGFEVFAGNANFKAVKSQGLELHARRRKDGSINLANLVITPPQKTPAETQKAGNPFSYNVSEILLESSMLNFSDDTPEKPYRTQLDELRLEIKGLTNEPEKKAAVEISFVTDSKEKFTHSGSLQLTPLLVEGKIDVEGLRPGNLRPYYQNTVAAEIKEGFLDLSTSYSLEQKNDKTQFKLSDLSALIRNLRLEEAGQREPLWRLPSLAIKETLIDLDAKTIAIGKIEGRDGSGFIQRGKDGALNVSRITKTSTPGAAAKEPAKKEVPGWKVEAKQIALDRFKLVFDDQGTPTPAKLNLTEISLRGGQFSTAKNQRGKATISARINNKGVLRLVGTAGANPAVANLAVDARDIELLPFQPYLENQVNFLLTGGQIGTQGALTFDASGDGPAKVNYEGGVEVADFGTVEKSSSQDLLKWKSLALDGLQFSLDPMRLRINEINLADFYSRLIIAADGKINLQNLTAQKSDEKVEPAKARADKPAEPAAPPGAEKQISIGKINLNGGNINFSDFFVKPNYAANLTGVQGTISELKPEAPGDLALLAKLDNAAPVDIHGKINPLSKDLFMDIVADAKEIEMGPFSPYSGRYVGYGIEKGKLSFNVKYKVENRKLDAENKIILNQLTFGERVESPDATKLPVLLAVALLKDRNGVIDINLPIGGSLDDPKFSVGGIVWQLILNILVKAVTSPFALLGAVFSGGSAEELSYVEFDHGRASLNQTAQSKIAAVAKAMSDRPNVNLELSGRVDPATDLEGLKRVGIERKVKTHKLKELVRRGETVRSVEEVRIEASEYPQYLKAAYGQETFPKPRNLIGLARDLPVPEMEKLMMQYAKVSDDDMRLLANQR
ncbi:MAG: DUF748 domain-containing protein, partial [Deltaproteobacteria bacterium]|nr:DUF748 domain-containing protein [Deltaproteobacteria bacterium]